LIGGPFSRVLVGGNHQQIGIRKSIPFAPGKGAVAEGFSAGVWPEDAIVGPEAVAQAVAQRHDSPLPLPAAQWREAALTGLGFAFNRTSNAASTLDGGRHLIINDSSTGSRLYFLDFKDSSNKIKTVTLADGT
jgi:hypothetical protein